MKLIPKAILALGVLSAGFAVGRFAKGSFSETAQAALPAEFPTPSPESAIENQDAGVEPYLFQIAGGELSSARKRAAAMIRDYPANGDELIKLLLAIARKDGASFDALLAGLSEDLRRELTTYTIVLLEDDPALLLRLMADSKSIGSEALGCCGEDIKEAVASVPDVFFDMVERGELNFGSETYKGICEDLWKNGVASSRVMKLLKSGAMAFDDPEVIGRLMFYIPDEDLQKLREGTGSPQIMAALEHEAETRQLLTDFPPRLESWDELIRLRLLMTQQERMQEPGAGAVQFDWGRIPPNRRKELAYYMTVGIEPHHAPELLQAIGSSQLDQEARNDLLGYWSDLFFTKGDIAEAVKFAQAIKASADGTNEGEERIVDWSIFDPKRAKTYAEQISPSPLRERILERIRETSPP